MRGSGAPFLALLGLVFVAFYYATRFSVGASWPAEALYALPPGLAALLLLRRGIRASRHAKAFWSLLGSGAALWFAGQCLWAFAVAQGQGAWLSPEVRLPLRALFIGFLVPMIGALALAPHPRPSRSGAVVLADSALLAVALCFVFARLVIVPRATPLAVADAVLALLAFGLAFAAGALWTTTENREWRRVYGFVTAFAALYGAGSAVGNGSGFALPAPGGVLDLVWIVPFFVLSAAALEGAPGARVPSDNLVVLLAGPGPFVLDLILDLVLPEAKGPGHASHLLLLVPVAALVAVGCALRLTLQEDAEARAKLVALACNEEEQRAGRLAALASATGSIVHELHVALSDVAERAAAAASTIGEKADRVLEQAQRAKRVGSELASALRIVREGRRSDVELGALLEEAVQAAIDAGVALRVSLEGLSGLPTVRGDAGELRSALLHLVRNAAQASPGGILRVAASLEAGDVVLRFSDDGPGVPEDARPHIFDPFYTTRRVGEGVGLGLTLVHFVARDHGGSVMLEPSEAGACFVLRLPSAARPEEGSHRSRWPFAAAVGLAAAAATLLVSVPVTSRTAASMLLQVLSALGAAAALTWASQRRDSRERTFWFCLAWAPGVWAVARWSSVDDTRSHALMAAADLSWAAALLLRPDRRHEGVSPRLVWLGLAAALGVVAYFYLFLFVLPFPFAASDEPLGRSLIVARAVQRLVLAAWVTALAFHADSPHWRGVYARLAGVVAAWAVGHSFATYAAMESGARPGDFADLGWIVPFILLAAFGVLEGAAGPKTRAEAVPVPRPPHPLWTAASLAILASIPAFEGLFGASSGHASLDLARGQLSGASVFLVGLILAIREVVAQREAAATRVLLQGARTQLVSAERRSHLLVVVGNAIHELGGHLSGICALVRLLLTQPDLTGRARADTERIQQKGEAAARVVRNLLGMARPAPEALTLVAVNEMVRQTVEMRAAELAQEGIRLRATLASGLPTVPLDAAAMQQVLLGLIDNAAVAIRASGREGLVEVAVSAGAGAVILRVSDDGPGMPEAARRRLARHAFGPDVPWDGAGLGLHLAREVVSQHGGRISAHNRYRGGAEIEIVLPTPPHVPRVAAARDA